MTLQLLNVLELGASGSRIKLNLLILTPFHDEDRSQFGWDGGPALVPAARLAADQINNRSDILPKHELVLIEKSIGCHDLVGREGRLLDTYARTVIYGELNIIGVVGPACSVNAIDLGGISAPLRNPLVQVTIGTSPTLEDRTRFPFTFSTLSSGNAFLIAMKDLANQKQWKSMGVILDISSTFWESLYRSVPRIFNNSINITTFDVTDGAENFYVNEEITRSKLRIFIVLLSRNTADKFMCYAYKSMPQLIYENIQWFFIERGNILNPNTQSFCTKEQLIGAFEKSVFLQYQLTSDNNQQIVSGQNYDEFNDSYTAKVIAYSIEQKVDVFGQYPHGISYAPVFYDAVWALGLGIDQAIRNGSLNQLQDLTSRFRPGSNESKEIAIAIKDNILTLDVFQGASGIIKFDDNTGQTHSVITFKQVVNGKLKLICTSGPSACINGSFIKDYFPKKYAGIQTSVAAIAFIFIGLLFVLTISIHLVNLWQSKDPLIKANSPKLNNLIFIGCYLLLFGMVLLTVIDWTNFLLASNPEFVGDILCNVYVWLIQTGFTLIVATVLMKTFRIYRIFVHFTRPGGLLLRDSVLAICVFGLVSPVIVLLITISVTTEHIWREMTFIYELTEYTRATCVTGIWQEVLPILYVGVLLFLSLGLSLPLRHINRQFKTVKSISMLAFCLILITWFGYPFVIIATQQSVNWDQHIHYIILMLILSGILLSTLLLLFVPPVASLIKNKWKQSNNRNLKPRTRTETLSPTLIIRTETLSPTLIIRTETLSPTLITRTETLSPTLIKNDNIFVAV